MRLAIIATLLLLAPALPAGAAAEHYVIEIRNMAFGKPPAQLKVGDTIEWQNRDIFRHTATVWMGNSDLNLAPGGRGQTVLHKAGTFNVYCRFHPTMTLRLTVAKR
jgi:plastocyanin